MKRGFTLVELAIVLIIIGIILSAVIKSTAIIDDARAKKNVTEITKLADAQHQFFERTGSYAGDSDNDGLINHITINSNAFPDEANVTTVTDMDYPFAELERLSILNTEPNSTHATLTVGGPAYYAGTTVTDANGNTIVLNMVVARQVPCLTAFQMELNIDKSQPDVGNSAGAGRVRAILNGALVTSGAWTASNLCGNNPLAIINLAYLFDRF